MIMIHDCASESTSRVFLNKDVHSWTTAPLPNLFLGLMILNNFVTQINIDINLIN